MTNQDGPFGELRGMFWDPIRGRYFPNPRPTAATPTPNPTSARPPSPSARSSPASMDRMQGRKKRSKASLKDQDQEGGVEGQAGPGPSTVANALNRIPQPRLRYIKSRQMGQDREPHMHRIEQDIWSNLVMFDGITFFPYGAVITHIHADWPKFQFLAVTQNQELGVRPMGKFRTYNISHVDPWIHPTFDKVPKGFVVRGTFDLGGFIPGGINQYQSTFQRPIPSSGELFQPGPRRYHPLPTCFSTFEKTLTVGSGPSVIRFDFERGPPLQSLLCSESQSDILALHQESHDIVFAGLRNSSIGLGDFRAPNGIVQPIATTGRKAITSVKRLKDSAVPFGLLASGMDDQLVLFDIRFGDRPLRTFSGHVNPYYSDLGITTSVDDKFVFAGGGDCRIRAWSLQDGQRLIPPDIKAGETQTTNPLRYLFPYRPTAISVTQDGVMDVGIGESVYRFGIPGHEPRFNSDGE